MITRLRIHRRPRIHMYMLRRTPRTRSQSRTHKHVIQGLRIHIKQIRILLRLRQPQRLIQFPQPRHRRKRPQRLHGAKFVIIARRHDFCICVRVENGTDEGAEDLCLGDALRDAVVDGRARVAVERGTSAFGRPVVVEGEKCALASYRFPVCCQGSAGGVPGGVGGIDDAWVVAEGGPGEDFVGLRAGACGAVDETDAVGFVEVCGANVAAGLAAVLVVYGGEVDEAVVGAGGEGVDGVAESGQCDVCGDNSVVHCAVVVLDLLEEEEIRGFQVLHDVGGDGLEIVGSGLEVLDIVLAYSDTITRPAGLQSGRRWYSRTSRRDSSDHGSGENSVEAKALSDHTSDLFQRITQESRRGVCRAIEWAADENGFGVCITIAHGQASAKIFACRIPLPNHPGVVEAVWSTESAWSTDGHELSAQALPKVDSILTRV